MTDIAEVLYTAEEIQSRVRGIGEALTRDYAGRTPILISVLKGGVVFLADLMRSMELSIKVDFMSISSYGSASGVVRVLKDLEHDLSGEHVVLVEDIIDTGLTLSYLLSALEARGPASLEVCTLIDKSVRRIAPLEIRYAGFVSPDRFLLGYGLDHEQRYRNLPFIVAVKDMARLQDQPMALTPYLEAGSIPPKAHL